MNPSRRFLLASWLNFLCLFLAASNSRAAIPGAGDAKAYTYHDYFRGAVEFNKRSLTGAYQTVGKKDPKWDAQATKLLDAMAVFFAYGSEGPVYQDATYNAAAELALANAAMDAGCDDPLVLYCKGALLSATGKVVDARELIGRSLPGLIDRKYPPFRILAAAVRVSDATDFPFLREEHNKVVKTVWENAIATVTAKSDDRDLRYLLQNVWPVFTEDMPSTRRFEFCKALQESKVANPWLVELFFGKYEIEAAWEARGGGAAANVQDAGWKGFSEHLAKARDHLLKAQQLHPEFPEAATQMISVAMGDGARLNETTRDWFDKAAKAQFDYYPAYESYFWSIYPRWGGSYGEMFRFGVECMESGRYDTYIPYQLMVGVTKINSDSGNDFKVFTVPQVRTALRRLLTQTVEKMKPQIEKDNLISHEIALEWRNHQYREAAALIDQYGDHITPNHFTELGAWAPFAVSEVRALTSPHAKAIVNAEKNAETDLEAGIKGFGEISTKLAKDDPAKLFVQYRTRALQLQRDFMKGNWVPLKANEDFAPWKLFTGDWKKEKDGTLVATADQNGQAIMFCNADFGSDYEFQARISTLDPKAPAVWTVFIGPMQDIEFSISGIDQKHLKFTPTIVDGGDLLTIKVHGQQYELLQNGQRRVLNNFESEVPEGSNVGIGIVSAQPGATIKFQDVKIRRLEPTKPK